MTPTFSLDETLAILSQGEMTLVGEFIWGSNYTFLSEIKHGSRQVQAIYKPSRGERPLWDFDSGSLAAREVAAYIVSQDSRLDMVPPTVLRRDAPEGSGSVQLYIEVDPERHYLTFTEEEKQRLRPVVLFDLLINNADRKSGHVLLDEGDHLWLIDHGVSFHEEYKLRTVIWDFVGEAIPETLLAGLRQFRARLAAESELRASLTKLLTEREIAALLQRADGILADPFFPAPGPGRPYPWPLI